MSHWETLSRPWTRQPANAAGLRTTTKRPTIAFLPTRGGLFRVDSGGVRLHPYDTSTTAIELTSIGCQIRRTSGNWGSASFSTSLPTRTFDSGVVVLGSTFAISGWGLILGAFGHVAALSGTAVDAGGAGVPATAYSAYAGQAGEAIGVCLKEYKPYLTHRNTIYYSSAGGYGNGTLDTAFNFTDHSIAALFVFPDQEVPAQELLLYSQNPWQLFESLSQHLFISTGGGVAGTTYTFSPSGSIVFSGSPTIAHGKAFTPSGSLALSGNANLIRGKVYEPSGNITFSGAAPFSTLNAYTFVPSGSIVFSGTHLLVRGKAFTPSGSITFSGSQTLVQGKAFIPSGSITFGGGVPYLIRTHIQAPSGQITFGGTSPLIFIPAGGSISDLVNRITVKLSRAMGLS